MTEINYKPQNHFSELDELELLELYKSSKTEAQQKKYLNALLGKHFNLIRALANQAHRKQPDIGTYEDFFQNAIMGCIIAYERFSKDKVVENKAKLSTFTYTTVFRYLQTAADEQAKIHCPTQLREVRSYFSGKYDAFPDKKRKFEEKYNIVDKKTRHNVYDKYKLLLSETITELNNTYEPVENSPFDYDQLNNSIAIRDTYNSLNDLQKQIIQLVFYEKNTLKNSLAELNNKNYKIGIKELKQEIKTIKHNFQSYA